jgi:hypothetical protein
MRRSDEGLQEYRRQDLQTDRRLSQPTTGCFARPKERYYLIARNTRQGTVCRTLKVLQRPLYRRQVDNPFARFIEGTMKLPLQQQTQGTPPAS